MIQKNLPKPRLNTLATSMAFLEIGIWLLPHITAVKAVLQKPSEEAEANEIIGTSIRIYQEKLGGMCPHLSR